MANTSKHWDKNIAKAMEEISGERKDGSSGIAISLPNWLPYITCIVFGALLANFLLSGNNAHPINEDKDYGTGGKVAVLMVAEDIESYRENYGELPDTAPNALAQVLDIEYQKLDDKHFRLSMSHLGNTIVFNDKEDSLSLEDQ